jgi:hypothetical protein
MRGTRGKWRTVQPFYVAAMNYARKKRAVS